MAKFNDGGKVRLKKDYYKNWWFGGLSRDKRKKISEKENRVARVTTNDMSDICQEYPNGIVEIRFNDRTFCRVHEDMLESVATKVTNTEPIYTVVNYCNDLMETIRLREKLGVINETVEKAKRFVENISKKHSYTAEQIAEAQRIIGELVVASRYEEGYEILDDENKKKCWVIMGYNAYTAHCSEGDEYNLYIGIMIAMCKANGRKVPDWVYGNE